MRSKKIDTLKLVLCLFFAITVVYPLLVMLTKIKDVDVLAIWAAQQFVTALRNSVKLAAIATVISLILAFSLAWCIERSAIKCKNFIKLIMTFPMLIPSISHGMGFDYSIWSEWYSDESLSAGMEYLRGSRYCNRFGDVLLPGGIFDVCGCIEI